MKQIAGRRATIRMALAAAASGATLASLPLNAWSKPEKEVEAAEDLMREHGVLRRALLVYRSAAERLRSDKQASVPVDALFKTATLFRTFGEDYHERLLEEQFIFPAVRKLKSPAAAYPDVLQSQHDQGRKLTDYVLDVTKGGPLSAETSASLAKALSSFELMYEHHTAREDTIVFTAWKDALSEKTYKEMSERFEGIEKKVFGHDGFEDAV